MEAPIRVMILDGVLDRREAVKALLHVASQVELIAEADLDERAPMRVSAEHPDILLISIDADGGERVVVLETISNRHPELGIIVLSQHKDWHYVRQYMRAGAKDYLYMPVTAEVLGRTVEEVHKVMADKRSLVPGLMSTAEEVASARTLVFMSGKGGVGKTTLATNVAASLALSGQRTVLVDLSLQSGGAHFLLNLLPSRTIVDLVQETNDLDTDLLHHYLVQHDDSGLWLLGAPRHAEESEVIDATDLRVVLHNLKRDFSFVVIDTAPFADDALAVALESATFGFLVSMLNIAVLKSNKSFLETIGSAGDPTSAKIRLVLNGSTGRSGMTTKDVEKVLQREMYWDFPADYELIETCANEGVPFVISRRQSRIAKSVEEFVQSLTGDLPPRKRALRKSLARRS